MLTAAPVFAADSVTTGLTIVEGFHNGMQALMKDLPPGIDAAVLVARSEAGMNDAENQLKSIQRAVAPGRRRYQRVYNIIDTYTEDVIASVERSAGAVSQADKPRLEQVIEKLASLKEAKIKSLEETFKNETYVRDREKPVPVIDRPHSGPQPEGGATIWDR